MTTVDGSTRVAGTVALGIARGMVELKSFFREKDAVVFIFSLPVVVMVILASTFSRDTEGTAVTASQLFVPGMIAGGMASTAFVGLGVGIASDREDGTLKRLRGTPMPLVAYFLGKMILVLVTSLASAGLMLAVGALLFDVPLPADPARWFTAGWVFLLGLTACSLLGIAASSLPRNARSAAAVMNLPYLVLQFISGIYVIPVSHVPSGLIRIGSLFPFKWMAQGFRSVFLPESAAGMEVAGAWEHGRVALILAAWCVGGVLLCLTTFRWRGRRER